MARSALTKGFLFMDITIRLGSGRVVEADLGRRSIKTDQPVEEGGDDTAPSPFDLFLTSIAACAGYYVLDFCRSRDLPTDDITLAMHVERNPQSHMIDEAEIEIMLPAAFPAKYEQAVVRAAELCSVKKHVEHGIAFKTRALRK
jgi:ribosomal protein S12 methylthiotransferase accessory factor